MTVHLGLGWRIGAATVAIVAAVILATTVIRADRQISVANVIADSEFRPSRARLSGPFPYRPYKRLPSVLSPKLIAVAAATRAAPLSGPSDRLHAAGIAELLLGERAEAAKQLGLAVQLADTEPTTSRRKAEILNDLAVAHYEWAMHGNSKSYVMGLDAAQKAWALDRNPPIAWTRAVLLEVLAGTEGAAEAWDEYLRLDPESPWADEVRQERASHGNTDKRGQQAVSRALIHIYGCEQTRGDNRSLHVGSLAGIGSIVDHPASIGTLATAILLSQRTRELSRRASPRKRPIDNTSSLAEPKLMAMLLLHADVLDRMRSGDEAWERRIRAAQLAVAGASQDPIQPPLAVAAARDGYFHAAELLFSLSAQHALCHGDEAAHVRLSRWRAFAQSRIAGDLSDPNLHLVEAKVVTIDHRTIRAKASFASTNRDVVSVSLEGQPGLSQVPRSDWAVPIGEYVPEHEQSEAIGVMVAESVRSLYQRESHMEIASGSPEAALWLSDRARIVGVPWNKTGGCMDQQRHTSPRRMGLQLVRCLPRDVTIVHQDLDATRLYTWVIRNGQIDVTTTWVSVPHLELDIARFRDAIERHADASSSVRAQAQHLYDILLRPVQQQISGNDLLVYSPSPNLRGLPVTALHDGSRFLIETRPVMITPTISEFQRPKAVARDASALVVLPQAVLAWKELDGARSEVRVVSRLYENRSLLLTETAATSESFLTAAATYDIIHVATHGQTRGIPYQNSIEFGQERIRAYDIFTLHLTRKPIVMLAACRTADSSGGPMNIALADAFLAAGASAVVGSLWDVEDRQTEQLSVGFHRELSRGATPYDALRHVQLQFIRQGKPLSAWAAFQVSS